MTSEDGGFLVGVVAWSDQPLKGRRLTAIPVRALLKASDFREIVAGHLDGVPESSLWSCLLTCPAPGLLAR